MLVEDGPIDLLHVANTRGHEVDTDPDRDSPLIAAGTVVVCADHDQNEFALGFLPCWQSIILRVGGLSNQS